MNAAAAEPPPAERAGTPPGDPPWTLSRWLILIALVFAGQVGIIFVLGEHKTKPARTVARVLTLELAADASELLALNDPTLFALPHRRDFASAIWLPTPILKPPSFRWTEPPRWLPLAADDLGLAFSRFMQTNRFPDFPLEFKPPVKPGPPEPLIEPALTQNSTLRIEDGLAQRQLPVHLSLTNWPYADVLEPSIVQLVVNPAGSVVSAVILPPNHGLETAAHYDAADQRALELARAMRFAPAPHLTMGRLIFNWHTVPPLATNLPDASP